MCAKPLVLCLLCSFLVRISRHQVMGLVLSRACAAPSTHLGSFSGVLPVCITCVLLLLVWARITWSLPPPLGTYLCRSCLLPAGEGDLFRKTLLKCWCWGGSGDAVPATAAPSHCFSHGCRAGGRGVQCWGTGWTRRVKIAKCCLG